VGTPWLLTSSSLPARWARSQRLPGWEVPAQHRPEFVSCRGGVTSCRGRCRTNVPAGTSRACLVPPGVAGPADGPVLRPFPQPPPERVTLGRGAATLIGVLAAVLAVSVRHAENIGCTAAAATALPATTVGCTTADRLMGRHRPGRLQPRARCSTDRHVQRSGMVTGTRTTGGTAGARTPARTGRGTTTDAQLAVCSRGWWTGRALGDGCRPWR
jgi:hypothetical protein